MLDIAASMLDIAAINIRYRCRQCQRSLPSMLDITAINVRYRSHCLALICYILEFLDRGSCYIYILRTLMLIFSPDLRNTLTVKLVEPKTGTEGRNCRYELKTGIGNRNRKQTDNQSVNEMCQRFIVRNIITIIN